MVQPLPLGALSDCGSWLLAGDPLGPTWYARDRDVGHLRDEYQTRARVLSPPQP